MKQAQESSDIEKSYAQKEKFQLAALARISVAIYEGFAGLIAAFANFNGEIGDDGPFAKLEDSDA
jgi:hypothetical protein